MGFFDAIFGKGKSSSASPKPMPDKIKWIRAFAKKRVIQDPIAIDQGFSPAMIEQLADETLIGLPEGTLVTIVETFATLKSQGISDKEALERIESHRSMIGAAAMPDPLSLESYISYRLSLEYADSGPISDQHISECLLMARTLYKC